MEFNGRLYFDFVSPDVFRLHQLLARAETEGAVLGLQWRPYSPDGDSPDHRALAASEMVRTMAPLRYGAFIQAMLVGVHLEHLDVAGLDLPQIAAKATGLPDDVVSPNRVATIGETLLNATLDEARRLGVTAVPCIYRHGPVVVVRSTPAVTTGPAIRRLEMIDAMLEDDGLWELSKP